MRGVKSDDLSAIVDLLYRGETNVFQENLGSFLAIAEELQFKGFMGKTNVKVEDYKGENSMPSTFSPKNVDIPKTVVQRQAPSINIYNLGEKRKSAISGNNSGDFEELEERLKTMMEKCQNKTANGPNSVTVAHRCKVCGKEGKSNAIKDHIEANHLEGIIIPCNLCDKNFRSRNGFRTHKLRHHTNN